MKCSLSETIITKVHAFNRINVPEKATGGSEVPRPRCAVAIKTEGLTVYEFDGNKCESNSTSAVFLPAGSVYSWYCDVKGECLMIEFDAVNHPDMLMPFRIKNIAELISVFDRLSNIMMFKKTAYEMKCISGVYDVLIKLCEAESTDYGLASKKKKIKPSLDFLENNFLAKDLSIEELAELSGISSVYFRRIFSEIYGISPMQYINNIKINKAKGLLIGDYGTVTAIAEECGFGSVYHFCKIFKKTTGLTPTEWAAKKMQNS